MQNSIPPVFIPPIGLITIYSAGKTWAAAGFREMRDVYNFNIIARWIDGMESVLTSPDAIANPFTLHDEDYKREIWDNGCKLDCMAADMMVLHCAPIDGNLHSGSLVELGHVTSNNRPCYIIGTCESMEPVNNSNRAWRSQKVVYYWPELTEMKDGFLRAISHYQQNFASQWCERHPDLLLEAARQSALKRA